MTTEYLVQYGTPVTITYNQPAADGNISVKFIDKIYGDELTTLTGITPQIPGTYFIVFPGALNNVDRLVDVEITYNNITPEEVVETFTVRFRRPYATAAEIASMLGLTIVTTPTSETQTTQEKLEQYEALAATKINALTVNEFNCRFVRNYLYGQGWNSIPFDSKVVSVDKVYRGTELSYDRANSLYPDGLIYKPGPGGDSLYVDYTDASSVISDPYATAVFHNGTRYTVDFVAGYEDVPLPIHQATILLVNDFRCNDYGLRNHYVVKRDSQFGKTEYDMRVFNGTGNVSIDELIEEYVRIPMRVI